MSRSTWPTRTGPKESCPRPVPFLSPSPSWPSCPGGLGLGRFLRLSPNEEKTGGRGRKTILADAFESVIAAIYLDGGLDAARSFVLNQFRDHLKQDARNELELGNYKSRLQERLHALGGREPMLRGDPGVGSAAFQDFSGRGSRSGSGCWHGPRARRRNGPNRGPRGWLSTD